MSGVAGDGRHSPIEEDPVPIRLAFQDQLLAAAVEFLAPVR
jgi:hypothetical protein